MSFKTILLAAFIAIFSIGCEPPQTTVSVEAQIYRDDAVGCVDDYCGGEVMSFVMTETPANADFTVGHGYPNVGDSGATWWGVLQAAIQESADREVWLKHWLPNAPVIQIPINVSIINLSARFTQAVSGHSWSQTSVTSPGLLSFQVPPLPIGVKITGVGAYWYNPNNTTLPVGTMPKITLTKIDLSVGGTGASTAVVTAVDATAVVGDYKLNHIFQTTGLTETVVENAVYWVGIEGETGANSVAGGVLLGLKVILGY